MSGTTPITSARGSGVAPLEKPRRSQSPPAPGGSDTVTFGSEETRTAASPYRIADFSSTATAASRLAYIDGTAEESTCDQSNVFVRAAAGLLLVTTSLLPAVFSCTGAAYAQPYGGTSTSTTFSYDQRVAAPSDVDYVRDLDVSRAATQKAKEPAAAKPGAASSKAPAQAPMESAKPSATSKVERDIEDRVSEVVRTEKSLLEEPLRKGMTGDKVKVLQKGLNYYVKVSQTGSFDDATEKAVREFQKKFGLGEDGVVGNRTFGVLWTKCFWEKGVALDLNSAGFYGSIPSKVKLKADLGRQRVFLLDGVTGKVIREYPISSGTREYPTPAGSFKITQVAEKPTWYPPPSPWAKGAKVTRPGPDNPLGPAFLRLDGSSILFHGVPADEFSSLGLYPASHGCMRMFPQDAWELHKVVKTGTPVEIVSKKVEK